MAYPTPVGPYPPQPSQRTNALAIPALVCGLLVAPVGIVLGHISLSQIKRSGEGGRGLALAGTILGYVNTAIAILTVAAAVLIVVVNKPSIDEGLKSRTTAVESSSPVTTSSSASAASPSGGLPPFTPPAGLGANCSYPADPQPAAKNVVPPRAGKVPTDPAVVNADMTTNQGAIGLALDNGKSPCTVNSFASLAQQGYFDDTRCHRLTTGESLSVLQCGDPKGDGTGGPGYQFANEYPTNQYAPGDPEAQRPVVYPRGTLAMANAGPDTNGSQFFIVYQDSLLPPQYTVFGTIDATGLSTVDKIAAAGTVDGSQDGAPKDDVVITSVRLS